MNRAASLTLALVVFLAGCITMAAAQESGQIRLECTGAFRATQIVPGPDVAKMLATFVVDFDKKTVVDAGNNAAATDVHIDAKSIDFQTASGAAEHLSRLDGEWAVSGSDGAISGTCKHVANQNAF